MRHHYKLQAFELADALALGVYTITDTFPESERWGLATQLRRGAVSIASNIVEGCARQRESDFLRFLDIAYGSAKEVEYQLALARRLNFCDQEKASEVRILADRTAGCLNKLIRSIRENRS